MSKVLVIIFQRFLQVITFSFLLTLRVQPFHRPSSDQPPLPSLPPPPGLVMGANLSKFLLVGQVFRFTASPSPPPPIFHTTNETIIHKPEVEIDSGDEFEYNDPIFLSSFYDEAKIVTISDSE